MIYNLAIYLGSLPYSCKFVSLLTANTTNVTTSLFLYTKPIKKYTVVLFHCWLRLTVYKTTFHCRRQERTNIFMFSVLLYELLFSGCKNTWTRIWTYATSTRFWNFLHSNSQIFTQLLIFQPFPSKAQW